MKQRLWKYLKRGIIVLLSIYAIACALLYFFQEKLLFHPEAISKNIGYVYEADFIDRNYSVEDDVELNALTFYAHDLIDKDKLIFYIHGNAETLLTAGGFAPTFTDRGYDCFIYDFRGFGKSDGSISSEAQLFTDAQILYDEMKEIYAEEDIIIVGYSIGTGIASWLASKNNPDKLILQAPYFSMKDMMKTKYSIFPTFLLRYPLENNIHLKKVKCPIFVFHGNKDKSIPFESSKKLKKAIPSIDLTTIKGLGHTGFMESDTYQEKLDDIFWY